MAFGASAPLANPLAATSTPATRVKPGASWFATGSVSANVPFASRTNVCFAEGSMRPSSNGKKCTPVGAGAPAGAVSVTTTFWPVAPRRRQPARRRRGQRVARGGDRLAPLRIRVGALGHGEDQVELHVLGNARLPADQPFGLGAERQRFAERRIARHLDVGQQQHLALVAEVDEGSGRQRFAGPATGSGPPSRPAGASTSASSAARSRPGSASTCASRRPSSGAARPSSSGRARTPCARKRVRLRRAAS